MIRLARGPFGTYTLENLAADGTVAGDLLVQLTAYCAHDWHEDCGGRVGLAGRDNRPRCACECHRPDRPEPGPEGDEWTRLARWGHSREVGTRDAS